ncbi:hypothetical protein J2Z50_000251 [Ensifer mexicanus]|nr:hypothetical protein [Sinorhizobium mexicanum]
MRLGKYLVPPKRQRTATKGFADRFIRFVNHNGTFLARFGLPVRNFAVLLT